MSPTCLKASPCNVPTRHKKFANRRPHSGDKLRAHSSRWDTTTHLESSTSGHRMSPAAPPRKAHPCRLDHCLPWLECGNRWLYWDENEDRISNGLRTAILGEVVGRRRDDCGQQGREYHAWDECHGLSVGLSESVRMTASLMFDANDWPSAVCNYFKSTVTSVRHWVQIKE